MKPTRFIMYYRGCDTPEVDSKLLASRGVKIVDRSSSRLMLVEGQEAVIRAIAAEQDGWVVEREMPLRAVGHKKPKSMR